MIHEVKINFEQIAKFQVESPEEQLLDASTAHQRLSSIISDLNQCSENYCLVLQVVYGSSLRGQSEAVNNINALMQCLTKRELEVLELAINGFSNKVIAEKLFIAIETVKSHRKNIISKAGVSRIDEIKNWLLSKKF